MSSCHSVAYRLKHPQPLKFDYLDPPLLSLIFLLLVLFLLPPWLASCSSVSTLSDSCGTIIQMLLASLVVLGRPALHHEIPLWLISYAL